MTDSEQTFAATVVEFGVPLVTAIAFRGIPEYRSRLVVFLGAVTPALCLYVLFGASFYFHIYFHTPMPDDNPHWDAPFLVARQFSLIPYLVLLAVAGALSYLRRPVGLRRRYLVGLSAGPLTLALLALVVAGRLTIGWSGP